MGYRIRIAPEVEQWLAELRESDPGAADLTDEALDALREGGAGLGPPLVVPVEVPVRETQRDLDYAYERQLEMLTWARRAVANVATSRKRLELQIDRLEELLSQLESQRRLALEASDEVLAAFVQSRQSFVADQLADLHRQHADLRAEEERQTLAGQDAAPSPIATSLELNELRPGAPESAAIRILFTVEPSGTAVLLAAGTERDWLRAWYAEMILRCRVRYERDQPGAG